MDVYYGGLTAQKGALDGRSIAQWSHIPITSKMIWIWIRILMKSWIRIRIGVTTSVADL